MESTLTKHENHCRIAVSGRLDAAGVNTSGQDMQQLIKDAGLPTVIDLTDVEFMASIGMRLLIESARIATEINIKIGILAPGGMVAETLAIAGIDSIIPIEAELEPLLERIA